MTTAEQRLDNFLKRIEKSEKIRASNKEKILEFAKDRKARGNAPNTVIKYLYPLYQMNARGWINKDFSELSKQDTQEVVINVEGQSWSPKTKKNFRITLKVFYKWLEGEEKFGPYEYPERVKFIVTTIPKRDVKKLSFNDIIAREEVVKMAGEALNPMHKALLWVAFESGGRPEEVLNMKNSDVKFDTYGTVVFLNGAKSRRPVRLVSATEPLRNWLRTHPLKNQNEFYVWVTQFSKIKSGGKGWTNLGNVGANKALKTLARRAGIDKRITMYSLRKGRATELAGDPNVSRSVLHEFMGWEEGSSVSRHYVKVSLKDIDEALLRASGIAVSRKRVENFVECPFCGARCSPGSLYCESKDCGKPLVITSRFMRDRDRAVSGLIKIMLPIIKSNRNALKEYKKMIKEGELEHLMKGDK